MNYSSTERQRAQGQERTRKRKRKGEETGGGGAGEGKMRSGRKGEEETGREIKIPVSSSVLYNCS